MGAFHDGKYSDRDCDGDFCWPRASVMARMEIPLTTVGIKFPFDFYSATLSRVLEPPPAFWHGVV